MDRAYIDWLALAVILAILGWVAYQFSRRTYRLTVGVAIVAGVIAVTGYGLRLPGKHPDFVNGLMAGGDALSQHMFGPFIPASLQHTLVPGLVGWLLLLLLTGGLLVAFDTLSTRRQQPTVHVGTVPPTKLPDPDVTARATIAEELKFRLPAVAVRAPASMPGGSTLVSVATVVSESGLQGGKLTGVIMQAVHALEARPRTYEVQVFVDHCQDDGTVDPLGPHLMVTVDLRDARSGQTLATKILAPRSEQDAAEMIAGFTARQVFRGDPSTPAWATGSCDGDDLSAYLLVQEMRPVARTYNALADCRKRQRDMLAKVVGRSTNAGLVQYELASLDDLDGMTAEALRLHLDNRVHNPRFLPARYRLAISLGAVTGLIRDGEAAGNPLGIGEDLLLQLQCSGLLRKIRGRQFRELRLVGGHVPTRYAPQASVRQELITRLLAAEHPDAAQLGRISQVLLAMACWELRAYRRRMRAPWLLAGALAHRPERAAYLELLRAGPSWWRHPRRRLAAPRVALAGARHRLRYVAEPGTAARALHTAQTRIRRQLGLGKVLDRGGPWRYGKLPWQAVYNAACLYAQPGAPGTELGAPGAGPGAPGAGPGVPGAGPGVPAIGPGEAEVRDAVTLLRLAITDPSCELDRPSEWIGADPSLRALRHRDAFDAFVREQTHKDFTAAPENRCPDEWFRNLLPTSAQPADQQPGDLRQLEPGQVPSARLPAEQPPAEQPSAEQPAAGPASARQPPAGQPPAGRASAGRPGPKADGPRADGHRVEGHHADGHKAIERLVRAVFGRP